MMADGGWRILPFVFDSCLRPPELRFSISERPYPPMSTRIRLKDIAERTGYTVATVSMALRQSPLVAKKTRGLILAEAKRVGYVPDPHLTALAAYRNTLK